MPGLGCQEEPALPAAVGLLRKKEKEREREREIGWANRPGHGETSPCPGERERESSPAHNPDERKRVVLLEGWGRASLQYFGRSLTCLLFVYTGSGALAYEKPLEELFFSLYSRAPCGNTHRGNRVRHPWTAGASSRAGHRVGPPCALFPVEREREREREGGRAPKQSKAKERERRGLVAIPILCWELKRLWRLHPWVSGSRAGAGSDDFAVLIDAT